MALFEITEPFDSDLRSGDPLGFPEYREALAAQSGESVVTGRSTGSEVDVVSVQGDFSVFGGSMGVVHGFKVVRAIDRAIELGLPVVFETRSGGARMQEGMLSLIQMGRCASAMGRLRDAGLASIAVLRNPSTGGVFASYASLCDLVAVEEGATVGFAGPRVAQAVTGEGVEGRSHTARSAYDAALVDFVGDETALRQWVLGALHVVDLPLRMTDRPTEDASRTTNDDGSAFGDAWDEVLRARRFGRPSGIDVASQVLDTWTELRGTDPTVRAGVGAIAGSRVIVLAHDRYATPGRTNPEGFRLAQRAIALANRWQVPIVTFIDTPGAEPGSIAEQAGIAREIAQTFLALVQATVPTIGVCVGEGGSGGALAFGVTDRLLIQEHAIFSVIGPEGAAAILHRDVAKAPKVAHDLKLTSTELIQLGIVDDVIPDAVSQVRQSIVAALAATKSGDRNARMDAATRRWIRETPGTSFD